MYFEGNNRDYYKQFKISHIEKNKKKILGHSDTNQNNQAKRYSRKWRKKLKINKAKKKYLRKKKNELIKDFKVYAPHNIVDAAFEAKLKRIKKKNRKYYRHHAKTQFGQSAWNAERTAHQRARDKRERKEKRKKGGKKKFGGLIVIADDDYNKEEIRELHFQLRIFVELIYEHLEHIKKLVLSI
ncbi:hypothetical protein SNEBB_001356 [Seison nebaliae]|nr:hypothetical protein SNEBB_001356 [Seison nebaliae]